ncbi:MAG: penicillin-binding transpeptidase domain-containing protein [Acutalibacteraceae bacterium]|nr:penicillin-binding transpeptidase domain-containing protein [Acutalibacteraceae bacterium]
MPFAKKKDTRINALAIFLAVLIAAGTFRMVQLGVVNANKYLSNDGVTTRTATLKAPRGEILDSVGREIAVNREGYNIVFNSAYVNYKTINKMILKLCRYLESENTQWADKLPISKTAPYTFTDSVSSSFLSSIGLAHYATSQNAFDKLIETYKLSEFTPEEARIIMGVRYTMVYFNFSIANPYIFAEDVPVSVMQKVSESSFLLDGVTVETAHFREYVDTDLAPHLIGTVGSIYAEEWEELKEKGYSYNDKVGKSGIEAYAEDILRGTDGEITYYIDANKVIIGSEVTKEPIAGKTVMLTIDKTIQDDTQAALKEVIEGLNSKGGRCTGGAAVVMNVHTGEIFASANYPTYDMKTYMTDYNSILNAPNNPLINRAFQGIYPIGSTIKPIVAIAGIDNGLLTATEQICCVRTYRYFKDYTPSCMHTHGNISLNRALAKSCNYFFFEAGRRVGASRLTDYFTQFGLGVKTGVEISDSSGLLADVAEGSGDTLQIAIGQKNAFTPLQMAVYTSTLANGGNRYKASLIDKVVSYDLKEIYSDTTGEVLNTIEIKPSTLASVKEGMLSVTEDGTGRAVFSNYSIKVGGKTGTAQNEGLDHSLFVAFAPFENPEIAIAVVLEHGSSGFAAGSIVKAALDAYFYSQETTVDNSPYYTVLD